MKDLLSLQDSTLRILLICLTCFWGAFTMVFLFTGNIIGFVAVGGTSTIQLLLMWNLFERSLK